MQYILPVSGKEITLRFPCGKEDILLCEWKDGETALAGALLNAITKEIAGQDTVEWGKLPVTDCEWALLLLRRSLFGDLLMTSSSCTQPHCGAKIDISFHISDYLQQFLIDMPAEVGRSAEPGWFNLTGKDIKFRLPTGNDQQMVSRFSQPECELRRLCVVPDNLPGNLLEQVEGHLESMAPAISGLLRGECPECGSAEDFYFDVQAYVLGELVDQAKHVFEDVHLLARHYHWAEEDILNLPIQRRYGYIDAILRDKGLSC
jgi:hypothetical protein